MVNKQAVRCKQIHLVLYYSTNVIGWWSRIMFTVFPDCLMQVQTRG